MNEIRLPRTPLLPAVDAGGKVIGAPDQIDVGGGMISLNSFHQVGNFDFFAHSAQEGFAFAYRLW